MADDRPVQHTPKHLTDEKVFDRRHPAASAFAVAQPAAGVVADDVEEKGQNLRGGPTATQAEGEYSDQKEVLAEQHDRNLRTAAGRDTAVDDTKDATARPVTEKARTTDKATAKPATDKSADKP